MSSFGTLELNMLAILNISNEQRRHCCVRVKAWKVKPAINDYEPYNPQPVQPVWDWRPNTSFQPAWWQNPVVSTC